MPPPRKERLYLGKNQIKTWGICVYFNSRETQSQSSLHNLQTGAFAVRGRHSISFTGWLTLFLQPVFHHGQLAIIWSWEMTWQAFSDLSSAEGTSQISPCWVLPRWVIFIGVYKQDLPLEDWRVKVGVWEFQSQMEPLAEERKAEEEVSSPHPSRWERTSCLHHLTLGWLCIFHLIPECSMSALQGSFALAEI